jgi:uncharacterized membrane protein
LTDKIISYRGLKKLPKRDIVFVLFCLISIAILLVMPGGFEGAYEQKGVPAKSLVIGVDNSRIQPIGIVRTGEQKITIKILDGRFKGRIVDTVNTFLGKFELDKVFSVGDEAFTVLDTDGDKIVFANLIDHYRLHYELVLLLLFVGILIIYAGWVGFKSLVSFIFTGTLILKVMLPLFLKGYEPVLLSLVLVSVITSVIIFLVGGFTKKGLIAFLGSISGIMITGAFAVIFGKLFKIHGAIMPFAESLLYSGFPRLDLSGMFLSAIFVSSSGAVMDVAMDVAASLNELAIKKPDITRKEIVLSGFSIGKAVIGTMTTTLLLAYSGGYSTLLMVFIAQGTPVLNVLNIQYVAGEILHTLVGSFGPIIVAPMTSIIGGLVLKKSARQ